MHQLTHFPFCPASRSIRLALNETGLDFSLIEENPWNLKGEFLALNPAGDLPVLQVDRGPVLCGTYAISEFISDELDPGSTDNRRVVLFPGNREERAEVRRLVDWFSHKLDREVTRELLNEKVAVRIGSGPPRAPEADVLRAIRANFRYHLSYVAFLVSERRWLAGDDLSFADLAAGAHFSVIDYLEDVPWQMYPKTKEWYVRLKSRPSFRTLLADRMSGLAPPAHYADLDF